MKLFSPYLLGAALALGVPALSSAQSLLPDSRSSAAAPRTAVDAAHAQALRRLLVAMGTAPMFRYLMENAPTASTEAREVGTHMARHVSDEEIYQHLIPVFAKYLSAGTADRYADHYRTSVGRRQIIAAQSRGGMLAGEKNPYFTPAEQHELAQLASSPAGRESAASEKHVWAEAGMAMRAWAETYYSGLSKAAFDSVAVLVKANLNPDDGPPSQPAALVRTGLPTLDRLVQIIADSQQSTTAANRAMIADLVSYDLGHVLAPERMVTAEGIASSRAALAKSEERIERFLHDMELLQQDYRQRLLAMSSGGVATQQMELSLGRTYDWFVRFAENQRHVLDLYARALTFAESRLGAVHLDGKRLMFDNDADLQVLRALMTQIRQAGTDEADLMSERQKAVFDALDKVRR